MSTLQQPADTATKNQKLAQMAQQVNAKFEDVQLISARDLYQATQTSSDSDIRVVIVDIRADDEIAISTIPNALREADFLQRKDEFKDYTVITYCTIGYRSAVFCRKLQEQGFKTQNLDGGILAWTQLQLENVELIDPVSKEPTKKVHVFGKQWELQGEGYESVMFKTPKLTYAVSSVKGVFAKLFS